MGRSKKLTAALMAACVASSAYAARSDMCRMESSKFVLDFNVKPSLVVHSAAVLDKTFNEVGIAGGAPTETVFSLSHTLGQILQSAGATNNAASREAFLQTMLVSFPSADGVTLNRDAGILMPFDAREERVDLLAKDLLDESSDAGMRPLALFNRFDLAPANWSHCGEHRIVYGKKNPDFEKRFLLIFEAVVPNPKPELGEAGCRPVAEFWAGLTPIVSDDIQLTRRLAAFYYEGKTDPMLAAADLLGPVVHYKNYGGDGSRGQVRGNLFMQQPWQLREWLTQPTFDPNGPALAFVVETVKNNPLAELYNDDLSGQAVMTNNVGSAVTVLHGDFVQALATSIRDNLMAEESKTYRDLVKRLADFNFGTGDTVEVTEEKILFNALGLGNDNRFNEHQSQSQEPFGPTEDIPANHAGPNLIAMLGQLGAQPTPVLMPQTADIILNRAQAGTCAGCHMTSPGKDVRLNPGGGTVKWPQVIEPSGGTPDGFVHVHETSRNLSPALETSFLPFRRYLLGRHLCEVTAPVEMMMALAGSEEAPSEAAVEASSDMRFTDDIIRDVLATALPGEAFEAAAAGDEQNLLSEAAASLDEPAREALRQELRTEIDARRRIEEMLPGAFVETRRPH